MSYANLRDMLQERGVSVNRSTIYRWFIEYAPALRKKLRRRQFIRADSSWQLDETYVKVKGKWHYLYRAINKQCETLDFYFSHKRNKDAAEAVPAPLSTAANIKHRQAFLLCLCDSTPKKGGTIARGYRATTSKVSQ